MNKEEHSTANGQPAPFVPYPVYHHFNPREEKVDLHEIWEAIWRGKWIIIAVTAVFAVCAVTYALSLPNIYRSQALLAPAEGTQSGGASRIAGQLGGLASLAGINLGGGDTTDRVTIAIEVAQSRQFITSFVRKHNMLPQLLAVKSWDSLNNRLVYDPEVYNQEQDVWVRDVDPPKEQEPSDWEAYEAFMELLTVQRQPETGFISVSIEHISPYVAQDWVTLLVKEVNDHMKEKDVSEARRSIEYLNRQLEQVALADMRTMFYQLIEDQIRTTMLAEVRAEYVFSAIDPAVVPEEKAKPQRALICIFSVLLGGILSVMFVVARHLLRKDDKGQT